MYFNDLIINTSIKVTNLSIVYVSFPFCYQEIHTLCSQNLSNQDQRGQVLTAQSQHVPRYLAYIFCYQHTRFSNKGWSHPRCRNENRILLTSNFIEDIPLCLELHDKQIVYSCRQTQQYVWFYVSVLPTIICPHNYSMLCSFQYSTYILIYQ
jgi:hypothetical protein